MTSIFSPPSSATTAWTRAPRCPTVAPTGSSPSWREATATLLRLPGSREIALISTSGVDLRHLELEQPPEEPLVRPADVDLGSPRGATNLEHVRLDVLADPVVLDRRLLRRREDRLDALPDIEDDRARLDPVDGAGDQLALAAGELVEDHVALGLAQPLEHDLLRGLGVDPPERFLIELLGLDHVSDLGVRIEGTRLLEGELGDRVLDLIHHVAGPEHANLAGLGVDPDVDVLVAGHPSIGGLDRLFDSPEQLLPGNLLLRVQLQEGAHEIPAHDAPPDGSRSRPLKRKRGGHPRSERPFSSARSIHPDGWSLKRYARREL
jgi:hypothetical protein